MAFCLKLNRFTRGLLLPKSKAAAFLCFLFFTPWVCIPPTKADDFTSYLLWNSQRSEDIKPFYKWNGMVERYIAQQKVPDSLCGRVRFHPCEILHWKSLAQALKMRNFEEQLATVNDYANAYPYITDPENWGIEDYWETPHEFLEVSGNCKDYAITKYYSLRIIGFPAEQMRIIIVQDLNLGGIIHAILGIYRNGELYILDNQIKQVVLAKKIYHYRPIYAINEDAWWRYIPTN